jgi:hypothetical protein
MQSDTEDQPTSSNRTSSTENSSNNGPRKTKIVIRDAAYTTWQALVYWLYTDEIVFAPLASTFISAEPDAEDHTGSSARAGGTSLKSTPDRGGAGRTAWIKAWIAEREGSDEWPENAPRPCSAKAIFRLADVSNQSRFIPECGLIRSYSIQKLDLPSLRQRAFQHIISQLTPQNIPYEVFSQFSSTYDEVRTVSSLACP